MRKITLLIPAAVLRCFTLLLLPVPYWLLPAFSLPAYSQKFKLAPQNQAQTQAPAQLSLEDRRKALNDLFHDYWEDRLKHDPEFASVIGDKRYNDQTSDYSVAAVNDQLAREQNFLLSLASIDPTGFTEQEKISQDLLMRQFEMDQEAAEFKEWEMPVDQMGGIYRDYPDLAAELSFATVKDYDDWIARLHALPTAFRQITENMSIGMEDGRMPPKYLLQKALDQVKELANQKPEDSPLALPLRTFPRRFPQLTRSGSRRRCSTPSPRRNCRPTCASPASLK